MFRPDKPKVEKPVQWKRILHLFRPYWKKEAMMLGTIAVSAVLGLVPPLMTMKLIDVAIPQHDMNLVGFYVGLIVLSAVASALIGVWQGYLNAFVAEAILRDLRTQLFSHMHRLPLSFFTSTKTGEIMNRVSNDVDAVDDVISGTMYTIATNVLTLVTTAVTIFLLDWRLALLAVLVMPIMVYPLFPAGRKMYAIRKETRTQRDELSSINQETLSISGMTLVKSFVREDYERERYRTASSNLMNSEVRLAMVGRWFMATITGMVVIGPAIVWLVGGWLAVQNSITIGAIVTFVALLSRLYTPTSTLAGIQVQIVAALAVFERIFDYLDMKEEGFAEKEVHELKNVKGDVEFKDVSFAYNEERQVLQNINIDIKAGQLAAFVGPSGAGKSTLMQLLMRFYEPLEGQITVDGIDISTIGMQSLRSHIGVVTQETYLFHDTIAANLRYGKLDATDEQIEQAAKAANIHEFIMSLPDAYKTMVGERGHKLSGGERQRLAIARVLLKNPEILILDEATSSLDSVNEALIQSALVPLMQGRTSLVIAHRLSTILAADVIFVVEGGRIVEHGRHAELLSRSGGYARLYREQFKEQVMQP
jgi:ATP-binding cassette, subfamily B, bacterial